jgi:hypothetical protein
MATEALDVKVDLILLSEKYQREHANDIDEGLVESLKVAQDFAEMHIEARPYGEGRCPSCDMILPRYMSGTAIQYPFCPFCGKSLNWDGFVQEEDIKMTVRESVAYLEDLDDY